MPVVKMPVVKMPVVKRHGHPHIDAGTNLRNYKKNETRSYEHTNHNKPGQQNIVIYWFDKINRFDFFMR